MRSRRLNSICKDYAKFHDTHKILANSNNNNRERERKHDRVYLSGVRNDLTNQQTRENYLYYLCVMMYPCHLRKIKQKVKEVSPWYG